MRMTAMPMLPLQPPQQFEDLRLDGHVERRRRFVGDEHGRVTGQGHGDHHALPHAAGHLVRIFVDALRRQRDADQFAASRSPACARPAG